MIFYKAERDRKHLTSGFQANKVGKKIENCDHQITSDVERFSEVFADTCQDMNTLGP